MIRARRAATALLAVMFIGATGCRRAGSGSLLPAADRASIYASVLSELARDSLARPVVLDALVPSTELDAEQHDKVLTGLAIDRSLLHAFLQAQRAASARVDPLALPDARWVAVSARHLDSLRTRSRSAAANGGAMPPAAAAPTARGPAFWREWYRLHPGSGGYIVLSPAGVSRDGTAAIVQVRIACGPVCGETELRLVRRSAASGWRVTGRIRLSES